MGLHSFRTRILLVGVLLAAFVVGTVAFASFALIREGMEIVSEEAAARLADQAADLVRRRVTAASLAASGRGLTGRARDEAALATLLEDVPEVLVPAGIAQGEFALYDSDARLLWASSPEARMPATAQRRHAIAEGGTLRTNIPATPFAGLFTAADLGRYAVHVPLDLPGGRRGVLDVVYVPAREERLMDSVRPTMALLSVFSMLLAVGVMQLALGRVLFLVDRLRNAADSIGEGELDIRLPVSGRNEIGDLARSLNRLIERLRRKAEAQTRFVADASHELATPVAGIRGYVNILRAWGARDPAVREESVAAIDRESRRMARLCNDLLTMIRSDQVLHRRALRYDVNAIARESLASIATKYLDKGLEFVGPEQGALEVVGDPERTEELLCVLLDNAAKYTAKGGMVRVDTRRERDSILVEVADTGIGISPEDLPNIFNRFYRSDAVRTREGEGFGLGLAIARALVDAEGGTIEAVSTPGEGTTFTVVLPRSAA